MLSMNTLKFLIIVKIMLDMSNDTIIGGTVGFCLTHKAESPIVCPQKRGFLSPHRNPHYHLPSDTMEKLDYHFMAELVESLLIYFRSHNQ